MSDETNMEVMEEVPVEPQMEMDTTMDPTMEVDEEMETTQEEQPTAPSLGLADLKLMANVIEVVSQRGAIRAGEMAAVGVVYNKLMSFLIANGAVEIPTQTSEQVEAPVEDEGMEGEE